MGTWGPASRPHCGPAGQLSVLAGLQAAPRRAWAVVPQESQAETLPCSGWARRRRDRSPATATNQGWRPENLPEAPPWAACLLEPAASVPEGPTQGAHVTGSDSGSRLTKGRRVCRPSLQAARCSRNLLGAEAGRPAGDPTLRTPGDMCWGGPFSCSLTPLLPALPPPHVWEQAHSSCSINALDSLGHRGGAPVPSQTHYVPRKAQALGG